MNTNARRTARTVAAIWPRLWTGLATLVLVGAALAVRPAAAQDDELAIELASAATLEELVGPIALYPDDLIAIVLPASSYPLQVVQAARFLEQRARDSRLTPEEGWDDSIVALLNYPEVVELLNDDLDWTYDLGTAVLNQRADVLDAIQRFRDRAYAAGNLRTDERQTVAVADGAIAIAPANPQVIYVPYYEPQRVVVYQRVPVYHYYPRRYPVYYYPYPAGYVFDTGFFWGVRSWFSIGWHSHHVHVYDYGYRSHPYYGWNYYDPFYVRNVYVNVNVNLNRDRVWEPRHRYGGRPVVRGYEGRVYTADSPPRVNRSVAGTAYRSRSVETTDRARQSAEARQPTRGVSADGNRRVEGTERPSQSTEVRRPTRGVLADSSGSRNPSTAARTQPQTATNTERGNVGAPRAVPRVVPDAARTGTYRSSAGMSQPLERNRSVAPQPSREVRVAPESARARQPSTGMPREASRGEPSRGVEMRSNPSPAAAPSQVPNSGGGRDSAQRGGGEASGGGYRNGGGGESSGGSYRNGGGSARGSAGR